MPITPQDNVDIISKYALGPYADGRRVTLAAEVAAGRLQKATFADLYSRYTAIGWTEAKIGQLTPFVAAWENEVWGTNPLPVMNEGKPFFCGSRVKITVGMGKFAINYPLTWHFGKLIGNGPGYVYPDARSAKGYGGTTFEHWADAWIDDPGFGLRINDLGTQVNALRPIMRSTTWGFEGTIGAYHELAEVDGININGPYGNGFKAGALFCGIVGWDMGSASKIGNIYGTNTDVGLCLVRSTPADVEKITWMNGNVAGVLAIGSAGGTIHIRDYECDDYPAKVMARAQLASDGTVIRESGGAIKVDFGKTETGVTPESRGPWKGTIIADLKGQFAAQFDMDSLATAMVKVDSAFVLDPTLENGNPQECSLEATVKRFACGANSVHVLNGPVYGPRVGEYGSARIEWTTADGCKVNGVAAPVVSSKGASKRLGFQRWNGSAWAPALSHANGTPAYIYGTEVAPPPTGGGGTGGGGGTLPPPIGAPAYTKAPVSITSGSYGVAISPAVAVKRVVITNFKLSAAPNWSAIAVPATFDTTYLSMAPDGTVYANGAVCTVTGYTGVPKVGTTYPTVTIDLPTPLTVVRLGTYQNQGTQALRYTATKLEMYTA